MSKDKKKKYDSESEEILQEEKKFKQKKRKFKAYCPHVKGSGKSRLQPVGNIEHVHECGRCHTRIDLRPFVTDTEEGMEELKTAIGTVKNALEIMKFRAALDTDSKRSEDIRDYAARMIFDLDSVPDVLEALLENSKTKKEKKKEKKREIKVGLDSLAFGKKKKKKSDW